MSGIYMIENLINHKVYIGQSQDIERRQKDHMRHLKHGNHDNPHLQNAWNKYGADNFRFVVQEECDNDIIDERERYYIRTMNSQDDRYGYNKESGGCLNKTMSDESKHKMSVKKQGMYRGSENPMYGVHLVVSDETKKKLSQRFSGTGNPMYGVHLQKTDEEKIRMSERVRGELNPFFGQHHSEETKRKMRSANKRKKPVMCEETGIVYDSSCEVERQLGYDAAHINACCNHKAHTAYGYHWKFAT